MSGPLARRGVRFLMYGAFGLFVIARNSEGISWAARAISSDYLYLPQAGCLLCSLVEAMVIVAYLTWLGGATVAAWPMPVWIHYPVLGLMVVSVVAVPSSPDPEKNGPERLRAEAVRVLDMASTRLQQTPCSEAAVTETVGSVPSGFLAHGIALKWRVKQIPVEAAFEDGISTRPGTVLLRCSADGAFDLAETVLDHVPQGRVAVLRDDVGNVFHVSGPVRDTLSR